MGGAFAVGTQPPPGHRGHRAGRLCRGRVRSLSLHPQPFLEGIASVQTALNEALEANLVGRDILGTEFSCTINVLGVDIGFMGGEETVQIALIKGRRGMPEQRPPYPAQYGLWDKPTAINCVETLANVPVIVRDGAAAFTSVGTATTGGTKILTVYDYVPDSEPKVIEVPLATPCAKSCAMPAYNRAESDLRAIVVGGAEGGALPRPCWIRPLILIRWKRLARLLVPALLSCCPPIPAWWPGRWSAVAILRKETCGKCVPCRLGVKRIAGILEGISQRSWRQRRSGCAG